MSFGVDRTNYTGRVPISFTAHHSQRISLGVVKAGGDMLRCSRGGRGARIEVKRWHIIDSELS